MIKLVLNPSHFFNMVVFAGSDQGCIGWQTDRTNDVVIAGI